MPYPPQGAGVGDMAKAVYDPDADGKIAFSIIGIETVADAATSMEAEDASSAAARCLALDLEYITLILAHANLTAAKAASIFDNVNLPVYRAATILEHTNLTAVRAGAIFDEANLTLARAYDILTHTNLSADKTQSIIYAMTLAAELMDILFYDAGDLTVSSGTEITEVNRYGNLTVNEGIILTVTGQPGALIVKTLNNNGTILKSITGGAGGHATQVGDGGDGGGGLVIFADTLNNEGIVSADAEPGEDGSTVSLESANKHGSPGTHYMVATDVPGTGGDGGYKDEDDAGVGDINGAGGGGGWRDGGDGGGYTPIARGTYSALAIDIKKAIIDWVIENVLSKSPSSPKSIPDCKGSGGGGGAGWDEKSSCGGGGGGGGNIMALCLTLNNTGTVRANAGNGGTKGTEGSEDDHDNAGGGGGGGVVYLLYVSLTSAGTIQASLGAKGSQSDNYAATNGTAGVAKAEAV